MGCLLLAFSLAGRAQDASSEMRWVGNVYGAVTDADTGAPIAGAQVFLFQLPTAENPDRGATPLNNRSESDIDRAVPDRRGATDVRGEFLINGVPTPFPFRDYRIVIRALGYGPMIIEPARVLPGAVMALCVKGQLRRGEHRSSHIRGTDPTAPLMYRHETVRDGETVWPLEEDRQQTGPVTYTVFATREGLVGGTTANGHIIQARDRFVALPSRRALNVNDKTYDFLVELSCGNRVVRAPVWDIGPWNTRDDYWHPAEIREMWSDLPEGTPEAQAARQTGYNDGKDQYGRTVLNSAGIDLADGTFWDDLDLEDNSWVQVKFLWRPGVRLGDRIQTTASALNVRASPAGTVLGKQPTGARGRVVKGPQGASSGGSYYVWWQIQWDDGVALGWCAENFFEKAPVEPVVARLDIRMAGQFPELTVHYRAGTILGIEASSDLSPGGSWILLTNLPLSSAVQAWRDLNLPVGTMRRYYRARIEGF
ncbi:MAG TPA: carboxypeptidase-like regulatory domain-containing protein [Candidatus Paceibacterota bacterium]|nr:carboxypeptidase-like regulatory domain-containing protein [Candidatus Paceibacterota bacterium]